MSSMSAKDSETHHPENQLRVKGAGLGAGRIQVTLDLSRDELIALINGLDEFEWIWSDNPPSLHCSTCGAQNEGKYGFETSILVPRHNANCSFASLVQVLERALEQAK